MKRKKFDGALFVQILILLLLFAFVIYSLPNALEQNVNKYEPTAEQLEEVQKINK
jgi:hypothetical protein